MRNVISALLVAILLACTAQSASAQTAEQMKLIEQYKKQEAQNNNNNNIDNKKTDINKNTIIDYQREDYNSKNERVKLREDNEFNGVHFDDYLWEDIDPKDTVLMQAKIKYQEDQQKKAKAKKARDVKSVFGREIFDKANITFSPSLNIPTPQNYMLGAGDEVFIDVWGDTQQNYSLKISPDGNIVVPQIGVIHLSGLTIAKAQTLLSQRFAEAMEGLDSGSVKIQISLGKLRSIKVNIVGEAAVPGTYTLPSLASLFNALYAAGGVSDIGSLRNIKLFRHGKEIAQLDVYDYLLNGDGNMNMRLQDNDMIAVEPYTNIVGLTGKVKRERRYELKNGETIAQLLGYAGGFDGDAYTETVTVNRSNGKQKEIFTLPTDQFATFKIKNRDEIIVGEVSDKYTNRVVIAGAVWRPGDYAISEHIQTVGDLIRKAEGVKEDAYTGRGQLFRLQPDLTKEVIPVNIEKLLAGTVPDMLLQKDDSLSIVSVDNLREKRTISIRGEVNDTTKTVPFIDNMTIEDAVMVAKGLKESASKARLEVFRRIKNPNSTKVSDRKVEVFSFTIPEDLSLTERVATFTLEPFDEVIIRRSPGYSEQQIVYINGEVLFDGEYAMTMVNETIVDLIKRAGGLTHEAYVKGASLKRLITEDDIERIKSLAQISSRQNKDTLAINVLQVGNYDNVGINLEDALANPNGYNNVVLKPGDMLTIPTYNNTVKISGSVYYPTTTTYIPGKKLHDYITAGGGYSKEARKKPFVIYMNGTVSAAKRAPIEPGCQIVVPGKPFKQGMGANEILGMSTSVISMMAMLTTLFK